MTPLELAHRIIPTGYRHTAQGTRYRIAEMVTEWMRNGEGRLPVSKLEQLVLSKEQEVKDRELALDSIRRSEQEYLGRVEGAVRAAIEYVEWVDGHGDHNEQQDRWQRLRAAVEAVRSGKVEA